MYLQFFGHRALHVNRVLCYRNCVDVNRDNLPAIMWSMVKPFMVFFMATNILCLATIFICVWLVFIIAMFIWIIIKLLPDKNYVRQPPEHESDILCFSLKGFVWAFTWCWVETMKWWTASIEAGNNVRGTQLGSLKSGLSCQIHTRNPERKRSALCCMVYRSVWDLIHFYEFYDLVLLKT